VSDENFISRWSRRKLAARDASPAPEELPVQAEAPKPAPPPDPVPLPPVESLTSESDFAPFMQPDVDPLLKRAALRKLFDDPRFNVMDGLDVYIDDYTKAAPIPEGWLEKMEQVRHLGIFKEEKEAPAEAASAPPGDDEKASQEQSMASLPSVTSEEEVPAPAVVESKVPRG
jgi:hypothetical protein